METTAANDDNVAPFLVEGGIIWVAFNWDSLQLSVSTDIRENIFVHRTSSTVRDITPAPKSKNAKIGINNGERKLKRWWLFTRYHWYSLFVMTPAQSYCPVERYNVLLLTTANSRNRVIARTSYSIRSIREFDNVLRGIIRWPDMVEIKLAKNELAGEWWSGITIWNVQSKEKWNKNNSTSNM